MQKFISVIQLKRWN